MPEEAIQKVVAAAMAIKKKQGAGNRKDEAFRGSDEEKEMIRKVMTGQARSVIRKVFGDDFDAALGDFILPRSKRGKGLASQK